jgi:two-component system, NarL family, response regulator DegU
MKIFLSESEKHVREAMRVLIEQDGRLCITGEADHMESLLLQVCTNPPDIILLDWNMRGMRHARVIPDLQKHCPDIRIIAMGLNPQDAERAYALGVDSFLVKTELPEHFMGKIWAENKSY